jgi:diphthamide synthase (EF-2-diphthine--ammonia ligase)
MTRNESNYIEDMNVRRAAVSFTGGKDCMLCLHRALKDKSITIVLLVTFAPVNSKPCKFLFQLFSL